MDSREGSGGQFPSNVKKKPRPIYEATNIYPPLCL